MKKDDMEKATDMEKEVEEKINLNEADKTEIAEIPMVGEKRAQDIIGHRPFRSWDDLKKIPGISEEMIKNIKEKAEI